MDCILTGM